MIGSRGEMRAIDKFLGRVIIGDNNVISELVTIQRPAMEGFLTVIGSDNIIMAHTHIGHDALVGDNCELCTGTIIGGYAQVGNNVKIKLGVTVRNRIVIEDGACVGMGSVVVKDVFANQTVMGNPAKTKANPPDQIPLSCHPQS